MKPVRRLLRSMAWSMVPCLAFAAGCSSDAPKESRASIALSLSIPKSLIDVDSVHLYVFQQSEVPCVKSAIGIKPTDVKPVFDLPMGQCMSGTKRAWCVSGTLEKNPDLLLTFYVEGLKGGGGFTGCTEKAVDQDPMLINLTAQPKIEGVVCGDMTLGLGETCDPGKTAVDEACDAAMCQTKEVILSNGKAANRFYRGLPGRKTGVGIRWTADGHFFATWADRAVGSSGTDGSDEFTLRRMSDNLLTETSPLVLQAEVRLPDASLGAGTEGSKRRSGVNNWPSFVPIAGGNWLAVWLRDGKVVGSVQKTNLSRTDATDFDIAATGDVPSAASSPSGDAIIAFADGTNVKAILRKSDGTLASPQTLGTIGSPATANRPRVAWVGGDWVVVWSDGQDIKLARLGADGSPKGAPVNANEAKKGGVQDQPDVAAFPSGEFLVTWRDASGDVGADIRVQRFGAAGAATGTEINAVLNDQSKTGDQDSPAVAVGTSSGGLKFWLVAWHDPSANQIAARFVRFDGGFGISYLGATSSEFQVGVGPRARSSPAVACADPSKNFCGVAWSDDEAGDAAGDDDRVRVRRIPMPQ